MKKVYLPNKGAHDYSKASSFGVQVPLTSGLVKLDRVGFLYRSMQRELEASHPEDYILLCGPTIANVIACGIFASLHSRLNLLIFRSTRAGGRYIERTITFKETLNENS